MRFPNEPAEPTLFHAGRDAPTRTATRIASLPVRAIRLDDYDRGGANFRLNFVKCHVEGAELPVLRGMEDKLNQFSPLIFLECYAGWTRKFGYEPGELLEFLAQADYDRFYLVAEQVRPFTDPALLDAAATREAVKLLCARDEKHLDRLRQTSIKQI